MGSILLKNRKKVVVFWCLITAIFYSLATLVAPVMALKQENLRAASLDHSYFYDPEADNCMESTGNGNSDGSDVYMIGDSDTVLSESYIKEELPNITINAQSSIWFAENQPGLVSGVDRIKEMGNQNILVFALGSNGGITNDDINKLLDAICRKTNE